MRIFVSRRRQNLSKPRFGRITGRSKHLHSFWSPTSLLFRELALAIGICLSPGLNLLAYAGNITYAYDSLGRLVGVVDGSGNAASYQYNNVGNLLSIATTNSSSLSIFTLSPNNGPVTTSVTIYGDGFSTTPSQNSVTFGGQAATVISSTQTTIATTVPTGAVTGNVTVTAPAGSASAPFTVTQQ